MSGPDAIFDTALLRHRLARAVAEGPVDMLLARTVADVVERLDTVMRTFAVIADIGTPGQALAGAMAGRYPEAQVLRVAPLCPSPGSTTGGTAESATTAEGFDATGGGPTRRPSHRAGLIVGDAERLPLAAQSLDLAVSALALQSANDLPGALLQVRRALKPDGLFLGALIGGRTLHELRAVLTEAEVELCGGVSPRVSPFADVRDMGGLLQRAGFALPVTDSETLTVRYDNLFALMADLRAMGATNTLVARSRRPTPRALFLRAAALYQQRYADADGRIRATFEIVAISGWAPHASQRQPAKRGSGTTSLAAALGHRLPHES